MNVKCSNYNFVYASWNGSGTVFSTFGSLHCIPFLLHRCARYIYGCWKGREILYRPMLVRPTERPTLYLVEKNLNSRVCMWIIDPSRYIYYTAIPPYMLIYSTMNPPVEWEQNHTITYFFYYFYTIPNLGIHPPPPLQFLPTHPLNCSNLWISHGVLPTKCFIW